MITYRKRKHWKYTLSEDVHFNSKLSIDEIHLGKFVMFRPNGWMVVKKRYTWDGPSGPTIDTKTFMRGSLIHDALYQLIREGVLPQSARKRCDEILREICLEDGMSRIRAWAVYRGVRMGGAKACKPNVLTAP